MQFKLVSKQKPAGDQPKAIEQLYGGLANNVDFQTLLGVTGSGKTFTIANIIDKYQKPTLVLCHNKTLAAQNYSEFKDFFPDNAVRYFVSYYDYYQPEAYVPRKDLFIEKEADINEEIQRMRAAATTALLTRQDVIIVASVSCIYGIGDPEDFSDLRISLKKGDRIDRSKLTRRLTDIQYERNDQAFQFGKFRVRGENIDIFPTYLEYAIRLEIFGDEIDRILEIDYLTGEVLQELPNVDIYPAKEFVTPFEKLRRAESQIQEEMTHQIDFFKKHNRLLEAERIKQRTMYDLEMLRETGYASGIENYSRYIEGRPPGSPPSTLLDYFPKDYLLVVDESHITLPQVRGMYNGDHSRKETLVEYGFRLPSALDNRPLKFEEFQNKLDKVICITATPADWELEQSKKAYEKASKKPVDYPKTAIIEQINRPTGLLDPEVEVRSTKHQIDDVLSEVQKRIAKKQRVIITTLTKRMAEDLTDYVSETGIKVQYLHSDIETIERVDILRDLRLGVYDVLIGINLLREGIDLPEVSLVVILDADKEGFLRSESSLVQIIGRAARHQEGKVIMYADRMTDSIKSAISETNRRRAIQEEYNKAHGITPTTIVKAIREGLQEKKEEEQIEHDYTKMGPKEIQILIKELSDKMNFAAKNLEFEKAAELRDEIRLLRGMK